HVVHFEAPTWVGEGADDRVSGQVPEVDIAGIISGSECLAVGVERHGVDAVAAWFGKGGGARASRKVPQVGLVGAGVRSCQGSAVRAENRRGHMDQCGVALADAWFDEDRLGTPCRYGAGAGSGPNALLRASRWAVVRTGRSTRTGWARRGAV